MNGSLIAAVYRTADDYRRYTWQSADRRRAIRALCSTYGRHVGRSVLDVCCGGGVLGIVLAPTRRRYVGVDSNPDMIRAAREAARDVEGSLEFLLGDAERMRVRGRFDTVTMLGNSLAHFNASQLSRVLKRIHPNVRRGSTFIVDYRDLVGQLWRGGWRRPGVRSDGPEKVRHTPELVDVERGEVAVRSRPLSGAWTLDWAHAVWSPFILEAVMEGHGWRLVNRTASGRGRLPEFYVDVYRRG